MNARRSNISRLLIFATRSRLLKLLYVVFNSWNSWNSQITSTPNYGFSNWPRNRCFLFRGCVFESSCVSVPVNIWKHNFSSPETSVTRIITMVKRTCIRRRRWTQKYSIKLGQRRRTFWPVIINCHCCRHVNFFIKITSCLFDKVLRKSKGGGAKFSFTWEEKEA